MHERSKAILTALLGATLLAACGDAAPEREFRAAAAALDAGDLGAAEAAAVAVRDGGAPETGVFLLGNVAFARALLAEAQADTPEAEPFAYEVAIRYARTARVRWAEAAATREDWPSARRNVERADLKLADLERKKAEKERGRSPGPKPPPMPEIRPDPDPPEPGGGGTEVVTPGVAETELTPAAVEALLDKLARKEREKETIRRDRRKSVEPVGGKDW